MIKTNKSGSGGTITLFSEDGSKRLYETSFKSAETKDSAMKRVKKREKEIEYFKNKDKGGW